MKLYQAFSFLVCLFLYSGTINAATEGKDPNSEVIHFLNNQRSTEKAKTEKEQTEMTLLDPLRSSERCCDRQNMGGDAHGRAPQNVAEFLADKDSGFWSSKTPTGSSTGSQ